MEYDKNKANLDGGIFLTKIWNKEFVSKNGKQSGYTCRNRKHKTTLHQDSVFSWSVDKESYKEFMEMRNVSARTWSAIIASKAMFSDAKRE